MSCQFQVIVPALERGPAPDCPAYGRHRPDFKPVDACQGGFAPAAVKWMLVSTIRMELTMKAIVDLFSTDYGLFSIGVIAFMLGMAVWFYRFFTRKMNETERTLK
jgi:hypothetical protein